MQKISRKLKQDLGQYLANFLVKHQEARTRQLKQEKHLAELSGAQTRTEVTEYSGLIGKTLNLASKAFPDYEPVKTRQLPAPENFNLPTSATSLSEGGQAQADNLTQVYNNYLAAHPDLFINETATSSPATAETVASSTQELAPEMVSTEPAETSTESETVSTEPETAPIEPTEVQIIELPPVEPIAPAEPEPTQ